MWPGEYDCVYPEAHTDKPAVVTLLHDTDQISFLQLQLIVILWHVTVQSLEAGAGHSNIQNVEYSVTWDVKSVQIKGSSSNCDVLLCTQVLCKNAWVRS